MVGDPFNVCLNASLNVRLIRGPQFKFVFEKWSNLKICDYMLGGHASSMLLNGGPPLRCVFLWRDTHEDVRSICVLQF